MIPGQREIEFWRNSLKRATEAKEIAERRIANCRDRIRELEFRHPELREAQLSPSARTIRIQNSYRSER